MSSTSRSGCANRERVAEYALRALPAGEIAALEAHIRECAECQEEVASVRPVVDALLDWPTDVLKPATPLWDRLADRIAAESGAPAAAGPASRWLAEPDWKEVAPGISCKLLSTDRARQRTSMLVRLAPGTAYPPHRHAGVEELHLLDGELWIEDRKLSPGDYNRAEPGTADRRVWTETGCTCVLLTSSRDVLG